MKDEAAAAVGQGCPVGKDCPGPAGESCPDGPCSSAGNGSLSLGETLERFGREAVQGVYDTGRYRCPYFTWGQGPVLLFIPGLSDDARSFLLLSALLSKSFRCIAYDLPAGRGDGARLRRYTHSDLVEDAFALLDHLGVGQSYVLGCSFGSTVALAALEARPARLPRAVLQGGFAHRRLAPAEVLLARLVRYLPGRTRSLPFRSALLRRSHHGPFATRPPEFWDFFLTRWGSPRLAAMAQRALLLHRLDLRPALGHIRQPVLLVTGEADPLVNRECEQDLLRGLPNAGQVELMDCGHNPLFTHPEVLAEVVREFLTPPAYRAAQEADARAGCPGEPRHTSLPDPEAR
jgi:pimeloyl-ACP methyl ester carboxylesterase